MLALCADIAPKPDNFAKLDALLNLYEPVLVADLAIRFDWMTGLEQSVQGGDVESLLYLLALAYGAYRCEDNRFTHGGNPC